MQFEFTFPPLTRRRDADGTHWLTAVPCPVCAGVMWCRPSEITTRTACSHACASRVFVGARNPAWRPIEERFWAKVAQTEACWLWTGSKNRSGYGRLNTVAALAAAGTRHVLAHRLSWELHFGPIPAGLFVCHHCDQPACVRPDHLFLGTNADNMADVERKQRWSLPGAKLTAAAVGEIRRRNAEGISQMQLARDFDVGYSTIQRIVRRETWRHID